MYYITHQSMQTYGSRSASICMLNPSIRYRLAGSFNYRLFCLKDTAPVTTEEDAE